HFLALGTSTFTFHSSFGSFNALVVGSADVRVKIYTLPNGVKPSSSQLSLAPENYQARSAATKHPSAGRRSHTRTRVCFTPGTNAAQAPTPPPALDFLLQRGREPQQCSCSTQKRRAFPGLLELVLESAMPLLRRRAKW